MSMSAEINLGIDSQARPSSRVLKPPGGGHSNIFAEPDTQAPKARPKYNQQNSSNLNSCMNTTDPNEVVAAQAGDVLASEPASSCKNNQQDTSGAGRPSGAGANFLNGGEDPVQTNGNQSGRVRVPPGGFSSGLW